MSWLNGKTVIYQVFLDRFAGFVSSKNHDKPVFVGGNLRGVISKLDYIKDLGADVVWISPFYKGASYHGYHTTDFNAIDEHFGNENDLKRLVDMAHQKGLKVICEFVPNHCSDQHPFFVEAKANPSSQYRKWFYFDNKNNYMTFLSVKELPKLNLENEDTFQHLMSSAKKWLGLGIDGFRIDHIIGLKNETAKRMFGELKKQFPEAVFIGEATMRGVKKNELDTIQIPNKKAIWRSQNLDKMYRNYIGILDGILDFASIDYFMQFANNPDMDVARALVHRIRKFKNKISLVTFLDNHDMDRFLVKCGRDIDKLKRAALLQMSITQPTVVYYGTEIGATQKKQFSQMTEYPDLLARQAMEWDSRRWNNDLLKYYKLIIKKRKEE